MFRLVGPAEKWFRNFPPVWKRLDRHGPSPAPVEESITGHVVIVGVGRVGLHIHNVLELLNVPHLVIEADVERLEELDRRGTATLYGDAANSEVLRHAGLERARALVVTLPDEAASELVVASARDLAPELPIIARAATEEGVKRLPALGAQNVIHPELEGGLEIVRHTLLQLGFPLREVYEYADAVRHDHYDLQVNSNEEHRLLHDLLDALDGIEVTWLRLPDDSSLEGKTLAQANLRAQTGASVIAIKRGGQLIPNPKSMTVFQPGDRIGFLGDREQIEEAGKLLDIIKE
jgi:CPA2 family monovalent cation:H+ antiporter-2